MNEFDAFKEYLLMPDRVDLLRKIAAARNDDRCPQCGKADGFRVYIKHYHCFSCGAHGDAISMVMITEGLHFLPAVEWILERYGYAGAA